MKFAKSRDDQYDDYDDTKQIRKKPKHSSNQAGKGMRILNEYSYEEDNSGDDYDECYETSSNSTLQFFSKTF